MNNQPLVSIIIPTYNRAKTLGRTIESILRQTHTNFEIIIVDDCSTDNTSEVLEKYRDSRICIIRHDRNKGVTAAKNTGLDNIHGEWFCTLDSDNEIIPETIESMLSIPLSIDQRINWIVCNCIDSVTGEFTVTGLYKDQYLSIQDRLSVKGELWGILKTSLLEKHRFNEKLPGFETTLWFTLYEKAFRYYVHKGYQIYHTESSDRITGNVKSLSKLNTTYTELSKEFAYQKIVKQYSVKEYARRSLLGIIFTRASENKKTCKFWMNELLGLKGFIIIKLLASIVRIMPPVILRNTYLILGKTLLKGYSRPGF
jgi:glycosyltransferase involved in cell wall biosynthesis